MISSPSIFLLIIDKTTPPPQMKSSALFLSAALQTPQHFPFSSLPFLFMLCSLCQVRYGTVCMRARYLQPLKKTSSQNEVRRRVWLPSLQLWKIGNFESPKNIQCEMAQQSPSRHHCWGQEVWREYGGRKWPDRVSSERRGTQVGRETSVKRMCQNIRTRRYVEWVSISPTDPQTHWWINFDSILEDRGYGSISKERI